MRDRVAMFGVLLAFFLVAGCAATSPSSDDTAGGAKVAGQEEMKQDGPCSATLAELAKKAKESMRTTKGVCEGNKVEATPMWSMNYDGTVHVRVKDAAGKIIRDEIMKP